MMEKGNWGSFSFDEVCVLFYFKSDIWRGFELAIVNLVKDYVQLVVFIFDNLIFGFLSIVMSSIFKQLCCYIERCVKHI